MYNVTNQTHPKGPKTQLQTLFVIILCALSSASCQFRAAQQQEQKARDSQALMEGTWRLELTNDLSSDMRWREIKVTRDGIAASLPNRYWRLHAFLVSRTLKTLYHETVDFNESGSTLMFLGHIRDTGDYDIWLKAVSTLNEDQYIVTFAGTHRLETGLVSYPPESEYPYAIRTCNARRTELTGDLVISCQISDRDKNDLFLYETYAGAEAHFWLIDDQTGDLIHTYGHSDNTYPVRAQFATATKGIYTLYMQPALVKEGQQFPVLSFAIDVPR